MSQIIPEQYMCYRAKEALTIDGHLTETSWKRARSAGSAVAMRRLAWLESRE